MKKCENSFIFFLIFSPPFSPIWYDNKCTQVKNFIHPIFYPPPFRPFSSMQGNPCQSISVYVTWKTLV